MYFDGTAMASALPAAKTAGTFPWTRILRSPGAMPDRPSWCACTYLTRVSGLSAAYSSTTAPPI